jgi:hypothetical protein
MWRRSARSPHAGGPGCWWRIGGAGATYELIAHLLPLVARRRRVLLMVGWIITDTG